MPHEIKALSKATITASGQTSSLLEDSQGAPLRRSPRGLADGVVRWVRAPEVKVWARPLFRLAGMLGVLSCVAFLGKQSEEESNYGARVEVPRAPSKAESDASPKPAHSDEHSEKLSQTAPAEPPRPPCTEQKTEQAPPAILPDGRIVMNEATQDDFTRLPGVGEARAKSIVELRTRMGKFRKVTDILRVRGIGWKTLQSMKELLVVDRPPETEKPEESADAPRAEVASPSAKEATTRGSRG